MHIEHLMTRDPVAVDAGDTLHNAARQMRDKNIGCVVAIRGGKVAGILTDRQITLAVADEKDPQGTKVEDVMTKDPARLKLEDNVFSAVDTMRSAGVARRIPVVNDNDELVGIVSVSDIAVMTQKLLDAVFLEETHHAMEEAHIQTGARYLVKRIRRPTKMDRLPDEPDVRPVIQPTPQGKPPKSGQPRAGARVEGRETAAR